MMNMTTDIPDRIRRRLAVLVEHLAAHTEDHREELAAGRAVLADDPTTAELLEVALADLARAKVSLDALGARLGGGEEG